MKTDYLVTKIFRCRIPLAMNIFVAKYLHSSRKHNIFLGFCNEQFVAKVNLISNDSYSSPKQISDDSYSSLIKAIRRNILLTSRVI